LQPGYGPPDGYRSDPLSTAMTLPNFIVIGAAKAGTTALYWYFAEHPQVFMSRVKETNYFAHGVDDQGRLLYGNPDIHHFSITSFGEYQQLFADAGDALAVGEVSPLYLECPHAAARIRERLPEIKLICCLRHPVDRAYSDYLMYLRNRGRRFDPARELTASATWARPDSHWMRIGRYREQLARYFAAFPREQLHLFLFDALKESPRTVMQELYRFVGVDPAFQPDFDTPHNVGGMPASRLLEGVYTSRLIRTAVEPWIPRRAANWVRWLRTRNMRQAPALPAALRKELTSHFRDDIARTSELIGQGLERWL
jgi:Sulfotransferase family